MNQEELTEDLFDDFKLKKPHLVAMFFLQMNSAL